MDNNSKCFIKTKDGSFEEITYGELKKRRKNLKLYDEKRFLNYHNMLFEVNKEAYKEIHNEKEKERYRYKKEKDIIIFSYDDDREIRGKDFIIDPRNNVELEVERKMEIEKLYTALMQLNTEEYELIKNLIFDETAIRKYAEILGIPFTTIQSRKEKIIDKLRNFIEN